MAALNAVLVEKLPGYYVVIVRDNLIKTEWYFECFGRVDEEEFSAIKKELEK